MKNSLFKKIACLALAAVMAVALLPMEAKADEITTYEGYINIGTIKCTITTGDVIVMELEGISEDDTAVPEVYTALNAELSGYCMYVQKVVIVGNISNVSSNAFSNIGGNWRMLNEVEINSNVTSIDASAFGFCTALTKITFTSAGLCTAIDPDAFNDIGNKVKIYYPCSSEITTTSLTTLNATLIQQSHSLVYNSAKESTYEEEGCKEYWQCSVCGKYFSDSLGTTEITQADTVVPILTKDPSITNAGQSLSLSRFVYINAYAKFSDFSYDEEYIAANGGLLVFPYSDSLSTDSVTADNLISGAYKVAGLVKTSSTDEYSMHTDGIIARDYGKEFYLRFYLYDTSSKTYTYGPVFKYSIQAYRDAASSKGYTGIVTVCDAMIAYGNAAEAYFSGKG